MFEPLGERGSTCGEGGGVGGAWLDGSGTLGIMVEWETFGITVINKEVARSVGLLLRPSNIIKAWDISRGFGQPEYCFGGGGKWALGRED